MNDEFLILNIREYLKQGQDGEDLLRQSFSAFSCRKKLMWRNFCRSSRLILLRKTSLLHIAFLTRRKAAS